MKKNILFIFLLVNITAFGQAEKKDKAEKYGDNIFNFQFNYTYTKPQQDLALKFNDFHNIGFGVLYKTRNNWVFAADGNYQFGNGVKDASFLYNLTNTTGVIMNSSGVAANYNLGMRGFGIYAKVGKIFPVSWKNRNSGIMVMAGGGMYYEKIYISTSNSDVPSLTEDLKKGYDRLCRGPAVTEFVGYTYHSSNRLLNFYIGFDFMQAFTKSVRQFNYDTRLPDTQSRLDVTLGGRIGWMIPIYMKSSNSDNEYNFR